MSTYVAFLLGINVGKRKVKMAKLKEVMESSGFENVHTLLASGNVVFESSDDSKSLTKKLDILLTNKFGFPIKNIVRSMDEIKRLVGSQPFKQIKITSDIRCYITFLSEPHKSSIKIPYQSLEKDFRILSVTDTEVVSVLTLSEKWGTTDAMQILGKEFGRNITTRNWNTIQKIALLD